MANGQLREVILHLRKAVLPRDGAGLTDGQLLSAYLSGWDEAALAALVRRHGPMVWGVCRRALGNHHDAEDAFQATFLVLVRRAASVVPGEMVANWLHGVAHQTARKARATAAKRRARERQVTEMPEPATAGQDPWKDPGPLIDRELSQLPDIYRSAVVLCDLEGKTRKEAARQLGVPEGTLAARLARGRVMLAKRLARRGLAVSGASLGSALAQNAASASPPASVLASTVKAAGLFAAGQAATGVISSNVAILVEGALNTMLMTKLRIGAALLVLVGLVATGAGLLGQPLPGGGPAATARAVGAADRPEEPAPNQPALKKSERGIVAVFKKIDARRNKIMFTVITNGGESLDLTYPMVKGVKVFTEGKGRKTIKLEQIKPGTRIHVYANEIADGLDVKLGPPVMEIRVPKDGKR